METYNVGYWPHAELGEVEGVWCDVLEDGSEQYRAGGRDKNGQWVEVTAQTWDEAVRAFNKKMASN